MRAERLPHQHPGAVCWGVHLSLRSVALVELLGTLNFQWLFLDAQRAPLDLPLCRELVRAANAARMFCLARVPTIDPPLIEGLLDAGVLGIMGANISSVEDARALVAATRLHVGGQATFTAALIESRSGIEQLDAIAALPGIDYVSIGANDLALSMGIEAGALDSRVRALVDASHAHIKAIGKPQVAVVCDPRQAQEAAAAGARLIAISDAALIAQASRSFF
jgi:4-hydroxy-2-oxoheptanedioate aldolase